MTGFKPKRQPLLSVIVPLYNSRTMIDQTLAAIRDQRGFAPGDLELIVVDDGSSDGGGEIASARADLVLHQPNLGAAAARNRGATSARADLFVFVDADVVLQPGALYTLYRALVDAPGLAAAVGRYAERPVAPGFVSLYHNAFTRHHHDLSEREIDWFWGALGIVRREAFWAAGGFDERYRGASAEDMELGLALSRLGFRLAYCPDAEGAHAHPFTLRTMLINDYQKAALGIKLHRSGRLPRKAPRFASAETLSSALLLPILAAIVGLGLYRPESLAYALPVAASLCLVNHQYYRFLHRFFPWPALGVAILLHWLQLTVIFAGAGAGIIGHLLGRESYGRPGWV